MKPDLCGGGSLSIDVRGLIGSPGEQRELELCIPVPSCGDGDDAVCFQPARVHLVLTGAPGAVLVSARAEAVAGLYCSRCLTPLQQLIAADFRHLFAAGQEAEGARPGGREQHEAGELRRSHEDEGEPDTSRVTDGRIDVAPLVAEALALGLPMKPLCGPDCRGLCPTCGKNLNEGPCACREEAPDPRLAGLRSVVAPEPAEPGQVPPGPEQEETKKEKDQRGRSKT
jgi:uncharacterized protein